jgi:hypothetical protein
LFRVCHSYPNPNADSYEYFNQVLHLSILVSLKRLLTTRVILTGLFAPSLSFAEKGVDFYAVIQKGGVFEKKFTPERFMGKQVGRYSYAFLNRRRHGPYVSYHQNGQLPGKGTYKVDVEDSD